MMVEAKIPALLILQLKIYTVVTLCNKMFPIRHTFSLHLCKRSLSPEIQGIRICVSLPFLQEHACQ